MQIHQIHARKYNWPSNRIDRSKHTNFTVYLLFGPSCTRQLEPSPPGEGKLSYLKYSNCVQVCKLILTMVQFQQTKPSGR